MRITDHRGIVRAPGRGAAALPHTAKADAMHGALMRRAEGCDEETEFKAIVDLLEAYEAKRWPDGKEPGGKG